MTEKRHKLQLILLTQTLPAFLFQFWWEVGKAIEVQVDTGRNAASALANHGLPSLFFVFFIRIRVFLIWYYQESR